MSGEGLSDRDAALAASAVAALLARWPDEAGSSATRRAYRRLLATLTTERAVPVEVEAASRSTTMDRLISADEAAVALGITPQAVTARCRAGRLDATQVAGVWVISADSVERVGGTPSGGARGTGEGWSSDHAPSRFERLRGHRG